MAPPATPSPEEGPTMFDAATRGLLPAGTVLPIWGRIVRQSDTAYACVDFSGEECWVSFDRVHGTPAPVAPLVSFG